MMRALVVGGSLTALTTVGLQFSGSGDGPESPEAWTEIEAQETLRPVPYGIPVAPLREPPAFADIDKRSPQEAEAVPAESTSDASSVPTGGCPVELRAIVAGGASDGFAMVGVDGESELVRRGARLKTSLGTMTVSRIGTNHIILSGAFGSRRCALDLER